MSAERLRSVPQPDPADDATLLAAVRTDGTALATLYDRHASLVYGLAMSILQNPDEAADLTQEIFLGLRTDDGYDPARGALGAYLTTMTRSRAIDRVRGRGRRLRLLKQWHDTAPPAEGPATPHQESSTRQIGARVRAALDELSDNERQVLELSYYRDMSQSEIAEHLAAPLGSVKSWARRGLSSLRQRLGDLVT